jgi:hypothetical protein
MMRLLVLAVGLSVGLPVESVFAVDSRVEAATKTFQDIATDTAKKDAYCAMVHAMKVVELEQDEAKAKDLEETIEDHMTFLGGDFAIAWELQGELDPETEDGKAYVVEIDKLTATCPGDRI